MVGGVSKSRQNKTRNKELEGGVDVRKNRGQPCLGIVDRWCPPTYSAPDCLRQCWQSGWSQPMHIAERRRATPRRNDPL